MRTRDTGFFTVDHLHQVAAAKDLKAGQDIALAAIDANTSASTENRSKTLGMVYNAKTKEKLVIAMGNFLLSHDFGQKVIK